MMPRYNMLTQTTHREYSWNIYLNKIKNRCFRGRKLGKLKIYLNGVTTNR